MVRGVIFADLTPKTRPMQLILTTRDPYNGSYCTPEGQVIYRVVSPFQLFHRRRATIDKVVPADLSSYTEGEFIASFHAGFKLN